MRKKSVSVIFLTVAVDLIGFGLILPLIPIYAQNLQSTMAAASGGTSKHAELISGLVIGAIVSVYSLMQFIFAPIWGRISDRIGRRPILLTSTCCACFSYVIFAIGSSFSDPRVALALIFLSRLFAGICGANITVAQAYIADITPPEKRSARMGLVGMAFGIGFILGPVLGGLTSKYWGPTAPGWTAAALCAINFIATYIRLGESWTPSDHAVVQRPHVQQWLHTLRTPGLSLLIGIFFLATFCFTCFEVTIGLLIIQNFHIDTHKSLSTVSWLIAYCGVAGALVQNPKTIARLVLRLGEPKLIAATLFVAAVGIGVLPFSTTWPLLLIGLAVFAIGSSLTRPPVFGMISMLAPAHEQGATMGVTQGVGSIARIAGPLFAASVFKLHASLPYLICAVLCFATGLLTFQYLKRIDAPVSAPSMPVEQSPH